LHLSGAITYQDLPACRQAGGRHGRQEGLRFMEANNPGSIHQVFLVIEASGRLWSSAVHGRKNKDRP